MAEATVDPRTLLADAPMSRTQILAVGTTVALNALDGFDVLAISFASPGITREWGIDRKALGAVLSMELWGMAVGSILLGGVADRFGRRRTILGCLAVMATGMALASTARDLGDLEGYRFVTGIGIGGMLAAINAAAAEFSSDRNRNTCISLMAIGYPLGAVMGGSVAALLLSSYGWRSVFGFGAAATASAIVLVAALLPESVSWLCRRQPKDALSRVNGTLARMGHQAVAALPAPPADAGRSLAEVFSRELLPTTVPMVVAYFAHITSFYFILKWVPQIVHDLGFSPALAASVLVWANVGGATGGATFGILARRYGLKPLALGAFVASGAMIAVFGHGHSSLGELSLVCAITGFFTNSGVVALYAVAAQAFPTHLRATGTGVVIGIGRGGAALAPYLAGVLFARGFGLQAVALLMGCGSLVAAGALAFVRDATRRHAAG